MWPAAALTAVLLLAPARADAGVIVLDNDVNISWSQIGLDACDLRNLCPGPALVIGMPRLIPDAAANGDEVFFDVDIVGNAFASFSLFLRVADTSFQELLDANNTPLRLTFSTAPDLTMDQFFQTYPNGILTLQDFSGFDLLPTNTDLIFALGGTFEGRSVLADGVEFGATITVSGAGTELAVPEPATLLLLTCGLAAAAFRGRRRGSCAG